MPITTSITEFVMNYHQLGYSGSELAPPEPQPEPELGSVLEPENDYTSLVITPICKHYKKELPCSKRDYEEQRLRMVDQLSICWDDSRHNTSVIGDLFGFWHHKNSVEIHVIEGVHSPLQRLATWSNNVGQGDRNVIILSPMICKIPWTTWENILGGASRGMGTSPVKKNLDKILEYLRTVRAVRNVK